MGLFKNDDDEFRFNDASTHEGHLRQNGELTWFCNETVIMRSHKCIKCKTITNLGLVNKQNVFVLRFYDPVNPTESCRERSVCQTTLSLARISPQRC